jgi:alcohol dehydrogenase
MKIRGAVLDTIGAPRPYTQSTPLSVCTLDLQAPGPEELLVRIEAAGLCHSDLSVIDGSRVRPTPILLGHEAAGIVEAAGASVADIAVGRRVVMTFLPRCEQCEACATDGVTPCEAGSAANGAGTLLGGHVRLGRQTHAIHHHLGVSGFATHAVVNRCSVVPVDTDVAPQIAAVLGCAVLTGGGAVINVGRPQPGQTLVVVGLGGVGMAAVLMALAQRDVRVVAVDALDAKLAAAAAVGCHQALSPNDATERGVKGDVVIEAAGNIRALETAVELTAPGGRTITVGLPPPEVRLNVSPLSLVAEGRALIGSYLGSAVPARDIPTFVSLWREGRLPLETLISSTIALDDINAGMDRLADGTELRQIIAF